jgi:hypothetical protein
MLATKWAYLLGGGPDRDVGGPAQHTLLLAAKYQPG